MDKNYNLIKFYDYKNVYFNTHEIHYRLTREENVGLLMTDYYKIINDIIESIECKKDKKTMIKLSIIDTDNPIINFTTELKDIKTFVPYDLFNIVENNVPDHVEFSINESTIFKVQIFEMDI